MKLDLRTAAKAGLALAAAIACWHFFLAPVPAQTARPVRQDLQDTVFGTGTLEAKSVVAISPRNTGQLAQAFADQGDAVRAGQTLAVMAADDLKQQLKVAESELEVTKAVIRRLEAEVASAQATRDYAELSFQRGERLFKAQVATEADFNKQTEARKVAAAALAQVQAQKIEAELAMAKQSALIEYDRAKLAETVLTSPCDGVVIRRDRDPGAVVNPGVAIMEVADTGEIWASVWVDEAAIGKLRPGQAAQVVFRAEPARAHPAVVRRLSRETDRETREFVVDLALEKLPDNWTLGQRLEARIVVAKLPGRLCVPTRLVRWEQGRPFLLVAAGGKIARRPVRPGLQTQELTEIAEGLSPEDRLVLAPDEHMGHVGRRIKERAP